MIKHRLMAAVAFATAACSAPDGVTEAERQAAIAEIAVVLDSMNAAWRRADFVAANRPLLDSALITVNGSRRSAVANRATSANNPTGGFAGQVVADYTVRYDVLARDVVVTAWENDFARIATDSTQEPMQTALMTIVWRRTPAGWGILHYHESMLPKAQVASAESLAGYAGIYRGREGVEVRLELVDGRLQLRSGDAPPRALEPLTDPNFAMGSSRLAFVRNPDGTVHGVLWSRSDGTSEYAWRISAGGATP